MSEIERDAVTGTETTGHEWDGIKELNTPLPKWWLYVLYATIVWSIGYWVIYPAWPSLSRLYPRHARLFDARDLCAAGGRGGRGAEGLAGSHRRRLARADRTGSGAGRASPRMAAGGVRRELRAVPRRRRPGRARLSGAGGRLLAVGRQACRHRADHPLSAFAPPTPTRASPRCRSFGADQVLDSGADRRRRRISSCRCRAPRSIRRRRSAVPPLFAENCVACHGEQGQGNQELGGPALNDAIWLYGGDRAACRGADHNARSTA